MPSLDTLATSLVAESRERMCTPHSKANDASETSASFPRKTVVLMRGLPSSGKSFRAKELAREGVLCETDSYLEAPELLGKSECSMEEAREANFHDFQRHIQAGRSPIVVDRGNGLNDETYIYVNHAIENGYEIQLEEPNSPWWCEMQTLFRYRPYTDAILEAWAHQLAEINLATHEVPVETILDWLDSWIADLTTSELIEEARRFAAEQGPTSPIHQQS